MIHKRFLAITAALLALQAPSWAAAQADQYLEPRDLKKLGDSIRDYIEARIDNKRINDAEGDVREQMEKLKRKLEKTPAKGDLLASPGDLGQAMWASYDYGRKRPKKGKVESLKYVSEGLYTKKEPLEYAIWAPTKYSAKNAYPLVITIPDQDVDPKDHLIERWKLAEMRDEVILASPRMPEDTSTWTDRDGGLKAVMVLLRAVSENYALDYDKIFLAGRGLGVPTGIAIIEFFPDRFAGFIGRTGDVGDVTPANFQNLATFFAGGGAQVTAFEAASKELGHDNCTVQADALEEDIWNWIQATRRNSYPDEVSLVPGSPFPNRAYWLQVPASDGSTPQTIHASIDRATNTVTVEGAGMTDFTLHFNDVILDMSKEITVIANGQEYKDFVPRSFALVLDNIFLVRCDPGRMFVAAKTYHLPASVKADGEGE